MKDGFAGFAVLDGQGEPEGHFDARAVEQRFDLQVRAKIALPLHRRATALFSAASSRYHLATRSKRFTRKGGLDEGMAVRARCGLRIVGRRLRRGWIVVGS